jgi:hypothetical protein
MAIPHRGIVFRSRWVVAVGLASVIVALLLAVGHALSLLARDHVIRALKETYASDLELRRFEVALFPRIRSTGGGLVFRYRGRGDARNELKGSTPLARYAVEHVVEAVLVSPHE